MFNAPTQILAALAVVASILLNTPAAHAADKAELPADDQYVVVKDGHLSLGGKRVRFWGFIGHIATSGAKVVKEDNAEAAAKKVADYSESIDKMVDRIGLMGFNIVRSWEGGYGQKPDPKLPTLIAGANYKKGDGSVADGIAYYFAQLDKAGIKLWMSSLNSTGSYDADDVNIIDDPKTADAWATAITEYIGKSKDNEKTIKLRGGSMDIARIFDPRAEAIFIDRIKRICDFPNHYKGGMRMADDPQIAVWEISNEEFPFRAFYTGRWQKLPAFFRNELIGKWNDFLQKKYGSDDKLREAWQFLLAGESLENKTILLLPLASPTSGQASLNDSNPEAAARVVVSEQPYSRADFARARGEDVIEFFIDLVVSHKQRVAAAIRSTGKSGQLSPIIFDSGNDFSIQAQYMLGMGDAISTCSYTKGMGFDPTDERYPFYSQLEQPPRTSWDVPWLEQSTTEGKPTFVYETNIDNRTKYRAEYPYRLLALASIQDWDIVCWHVYGGKDKMEGDRPFDDSIHVGHDHFEYRGDEVLIGAMRAAGLAFRNFAIAPAPEPTRFIFGRKTLFDPESMSYGKSFGDSADKFIPTTYRYGSRVIIDPTREKDEIDGPTARPNIYISNPVQPTDQIAFDWRRGNLKIDAPATVSFVGFFAKLAEAKLTFKNSDVVIDQVEIRNDEGISFPMTKNEMYFGISLTAKDGEALNKAKQLTLAVQSTSFNTGYKLDLTKGAKGRQQDGPDVRGPQEFWGAWTSAMGTQPVLQARVSCRITAPALAGRTFKALDWNSNVLDEGTVGQDGVFVLAKDKPVFSVEFTAGDQAE